MIFVHLHFLNCLLFLFGFGILINKFFINLLSLIFAGQNFRVSIRIFENYFLSWQLMVCVSGRNRVSFACRVQQVNVEPKLWMFLCLSPFTSLPLRCHIRRVYACAVPRHPDSGVKAKQNIPHFFTCLLSNTHAFHMCRIREIVRFALRHSQTSYVYRRCWSFYRFANF